MNIKTWVENNRKIIKIASISFLGILAVLTFALIPINIFCANFPRWVTILLSVLFCGGLVAYLIFFKTKLVTKIILPIILDLSLSFVRLFRIFFRIGIRMLSKAITVKY